MKLPVEKNKIYEMYVEDIGIHGEGIGKIDGYTVFVEGALPHEHIKVLIVKTTVWLWKIAGNIATIPKTYHTKMSCGR